MQVVLNRSEVLVTDPHCDGGKIDSGLEKVHSAGVPKGMDPNPAAGERPTVIGCRARMIWDQLADGITAERVPRRSRKDCALRVPTSLVQPRP